ncbi:MAG: RNA-binding S4 domain-containing protein [Burkholderiaceae bacterium]|nr:RNA-binding S4 domain-containing protein [Burkholderiaceae bacterium]MEB2350247.1 RNA-binding S4 domain-containing protein [Burkholderiaceae bacterium]
MSNPLSPECAGADAPGSVRIDKWLWAARFFRTRSLAQQAIERGRVLVGGERVKLARPLRIGDEVCVRSGDIERTVQVLALSDVRGAAPVARTLYLEAAESVARRVQRRDERRLGVEPAAAIEGGRPTKRDRRRLGRVRARGVDEDP